MTCFDCGKTINGIPYIRSIISIKGKITQYVCINCFNTAIRNHFANFANQYLGNWNKIDEVEEMPKATLSYEALQLDSEGIPTEGAYKLKLEGNFKTHIEPIVKFIKASIPSSDRTYDPTTYEWAFHERFWPLMEQAFKGSHFQVQFTVRKEDFVELKRKQAEFAKQAGQTFQTHQYDTNKDINKFFELLTPVLLKIDFPFVCGGIPTDFNLTAIQNIDRSQAEKAYKKAIRFYHPDLHPERAAQASELNEIWSRLKESYYIK